MRRRLQLRIVRLALPNEHKEISMDVRQEMLDEFREELSTTKRLLERVPEDKLAWQPHTKSMALGPTGHALGNTAR